MSKKYKTTLFTFIDILGFREIVKNRNAKEIFEILSYLKKWSKPDEELAEIYEMDFCNFSDSVLRATKIYSKSNKKYPTGILFHELLDLVYIIVELTKYDIFIRGSVCIGLFYREKDMFLALH